MPQLKLFINNYLQPYAKMNIDFDDCETLIEREEHCKDVATLLYWQYAPKIHSLKLDCTVYLYHESKMNDKNFITK